MGDPLRVAPGQDGVAPGMVPEMTPEVAPAVAPARDMPRAITGSRLAQDVNGNGGFLHSPQTPRPGQAPPHPRLKTGWGCEWHRRLLRCPGTPRRFPASRGARQAPAWGLPRRATAACARTTTPTPSPPPRA